MSTEQQIQATLDDLTKRVESLTNSTGGLATSVQNTSGEVSTLKAELGAIKRVIKEMKTRDASKRMVVAIAFVILLALLPGFVIRWPVRSSQAAVLCCVVVCGTLLGVVCFLTGRQKCDDD